ncbi:hypothetical protein D7O18_26365 [Salmonella enterica subsp. enterica serovar Muenchen]|nr:hypothetical protein [Salmonella enterica subsp. enterica serovar Muenchen]
MHDKKLMFADIKIQPDYGFCQTECWQRGHEGGMTPFLTSLTLTVAQLAMERSRQKMMTGFICVRPR